MMKRSAIALRLPKWSKLPGGYSHTLPIRVCAAQLGRDFEAPDLERGIHFRGVFVERGIIFRTHESSSFVSSHLKLFKTDCF